MTFSTRSWGCVRYMERSKMEVSDPTLPGYLEKEEQAASAIQRQIEFTRFYQDIGVKKRLGRT